VGDGPQASGQEVGRERERRGEGGGRTVEGAGLQHTGHASRTRTWGLLRGLRGLDRGIAVHVPATTAGTDAWNAEGLCVKVLRPWHALVEASRPRRDREGDNAPVDVLAPRGCRRAIGGALPFLFFLKHSRALRGTWAEQMVVKERLYQSGAHPPPLHFLMGGK
jgi:hypothetical protein